MGNEIWVPITGFETYEISNFGRVRNDRGQILKLRKTRSRNSVQVVLYHEGERYVYAIHTMVARHFLRNFREHSIVGHKDLDIYNNHSANLYMKGRHHSVQHGGMLERTGERVRNITYSLIFENAYEAAEYVRGDPSSIYKVVKGERETHKGCRFGPVDADYGY